MFKAAKRLGDKLIVIVSNDEQVKIKRNFEFLPLCHRMTLIKELRDVDEVSPSIDKDRSVAQTLCMLNPDIFASGCEADHPDSTEEKIVCDALGIEMVFNVGGDKLMSSSDLLKKVK